MVGLLNDGLSAATASTDSGVTPNAGVSNGGVTANGIQSGSIANDTSGQGHKFAGKYNTLEKFEEGYNNASAKIREQAEELKRMKELYSPPETYNLDNWINNNDFKHVNKEAPEIQHALNAFKEAGISETQAEKIFTNYIAKLSENTLSPEDFRKQEISKLGGPEQYKTISNKLRDVMAKLPTEQQDIFDSMCNSAESLKLMHDLLFPKQLNIPVKIDPDPETDYEEMLKQLEAEATEYRRKHESSYNSHPEKVEEYAKIVDKILKLDEKIKSSNKKK